MFRSTLLRAVRGANANATAVKITPSTQVLVNSKRNAATGIPTHEEPPRLHRTPDDNKTLPGEYPFIGSWIIAEDRQIDPTYPHVITERAAHRNPIGKNYDDECERRNFGDPVHEDDELFSIYIYDWTKNTSNSQAMMQSFGAFSLFFIAWTYSKSEEEPLTVGKELPYAASSHAFSSFNPPKEN